ncbi:MAG: AAA family ATPase [Desulfamplus sp.]|nr:AAA family ATPase [Desulfamplus sp.]
MMIKSDTIKKIPYGAGDFESVQLAHDYYVDKTSYIPEIAMNRFNFLIRPRRFGKTLLLSMLHSYYDILKKDRFEDLFHDTWILNHPTSDRGAYMILYFNFSAITKDRDYIQSDFNTYCSDNIDHFIYTYRDFLPPIVTEKVARKKTAHEKLHHLSRSLVKSDAKIYLLIDEYDNFANSLLADYGPYEYRKLTGKTGYFKQFFTNLKDMASGSDSGLARMFITGVSPVTMDDVTSGFNIGNNISLDDVFSDILGFTKQDVMDLIDYYVSSGVFKLDREESLEIMEKWYGNYLFSRRARQKLFNTDAVLYFMVRAMNNRGMVDDLIDDNLRMDYGKLRHLMVLDRSLSHHQKTEDGLENRLNGNFTRLKEIIEERAIESIINKSFPYERLVDSGNFISLLYFFGLLTFKGSDPQGDPVLTIPNETVQTLMYEYIKASYEDVDIFSVDIYLLRKKFREMAYQGEFKPVFEFLAAEIRRQTKIRDYIEGEKVIQGFFMAYFGLFDFYLSLSEEELNKGYADIVLKPFYLKYPDIKYGFLFEFKYIPRTNNKKAFDVILAHKIEESKAQITKYTNDENLEKIMHTGRYGDVTLKRGIVVFHGWEMVYICDES